MPAPDEPLIPMSELSRPRRRSNFPGTQLDLTKIAFPTDRLTVKDLRRYCPTAFDLPAGEGHLYDVEGLFDRVSLETVLGAVLDAERQLAHRAYCKARGMPPPQQLSDQEGLVESLTADYAAMGLSSGPRHAEQLIRSFEEAAAKQARQHAPNLPPR
jgi:hypothetical protein